MRAYWNHLTHRERWMLGGGTLFCVVVLCYLMVYKPLVGAVQEKYQRLLETQNTLSFLQQAKVKLNTTKRRQKLSQGQLLTRLADQLKSSRFHQFSYQLQQTSATEIQLVFERVPFNALMLWLRSLSEQYAFEIKQLNSERTETPGVVQLTMIIQ